MIKGVDISLWNWDYLSRVNFAPLKDLTMFTLMKASEGSTYKDRKLDLYYNILHGSGNGRPDKDRMYGFYHFARPENMNTPEQEAANFLGLIRHHAGHAIFALDVEAGALSLTQARLDKWVYEWCRIVYESVGVKPLIYCSAAETKRFPRAAEYDCGLWVAKWSSKKPTKKEILPWKIYAIWQDGTNNGLIDSNQFNGTPEQWRAYCAKQ